MSDSSDRTYHVDGELVPADAATVHVEDRGFAYGDAAVETLRAYGGEVFRWSDHAERLASTCEALALDHGLDDAELKRRVDETLAANDLSDAGVRLSITRGRQPGGFGPEPPLDPRAEADPTVVVVVWPAARGGVGSAPAHDGPAALQTTKTRTVSDRAVPADARTHNRLNRILARLELRVTGADEALVLDADGHVAEGAAATLFFADGTGLKTPSLDGPVLPGVVREVVIEIADAEGIPVEEGTYTPSDVREADEVFLTNTRWELRPVRTVDGIDVGSDGEGVAGALTTLLSRLFDRHVEERHYDGERC